MKRKQGRVTERSRTVREKGKRRNFLSQETSVLLDLPAKLMGAPFTLDPFTDPISYRNRTTV
jgi:hypothetical protein